VARSTTERNFEQRIAELEAINKDLLAIADNTALIMAGHTIAQLKEQVAELEQQLAELRKAAQRVCVTYVMDGIGLEEAIGKLNQLTKPNEVNNGKSSQ
jgi:hypothetical protein